MIRHFSIPRKYYQSYATLKSLPLSTEYEITKSITNVHTRANKVEQKSNTSLATNRASINLPIKRAKSSSMTRVEERDLQIPWTDVMRIINDASTWKKCRVGTRRKCRARGFSKKATIDLRIMERRV